MKAAKLEIGIRSQESGVRRKEEEGRRKEEEGRSHNKCFYKYEMLPKFHRIQFFYFWVLSLLSE
ncbi:hypothetical protein [Microcoleus sp. D2_18a_B4]|uniref:hypothetical protein n=1 Tax=Microcoleus sp. D2_18a_B4 TaxID=3055329 RepID=UPI002FD04BC5